VGTAGTVDADGVDDSGLAVDDAGRVLLSPPPLNTPIMMTAPIKPRQPQLTRTGEDDAFIELPQLGQNLAFGSGLTDLHFGQDAPDACVGFIFFGLLPATNAWPQSQY
jgi:hypothetical protein